jgi:DNA-binding winged helix-turn-helix (wHTH) protein
LTIARAGAQSSSGFLAVFFRYAPVATGMAALDFRLGDFIVQPAADRLVGQARGQRIDLEPKTMAVLLALAERSGQVVSSHELIRLVWHDRPMGDNPVYKAIARLHRVLEDEAGEPRFIETIPRKGYRLLVTPEALVADAVSRSHAATAPPRPGYLGAAVSFAAVVALVALMPRISDSFGRVRHGVGVAERPAHSRSLSPEANQLYLLARAELSERRPGFVSRLGNAADDLIREAPDFAAAYALRAIACTLHAGYAVDAPVAAAAPPSHEPAIDLDCAEQAVRHALMEAGRGAGGGWFSRLRRILAVPRCLRP